MWCSCFRMTKKCGFILIHLSWVDMFFPTGIIRCIRLTYKLADIHHSEQLEGWVHCISTWCCFATLLHKITLLPHFYNQSMTLLFWPQIVMNPSDLCSGCELVCIGQSQEIAVLAGFLCSGTKWRLKFWSLEVYGIELQWSSKLPQLNTFLFPNRLRKDIVDLA